MDFAAGLVLGCLLGVVATTGTLLLIAATTNGTVRRRKGVSPSGLAGAAFAILVVTTASRLVNLRHGSLVLLLWLIIVTVSRLRGLYTGLAASVFAALALAVVFPPGRSLKVTQPRDQLLLALFILGGALASHLASGTAVPAQDNAGDTSGLQSESNAALVVSASCSEEQAS